MARDHENQREGRGDSRRIAAFGNLDRTTLWALIGGSAVAAGLGFVFGRRYLSRTGSEDPVALLPAPALAGDRPEGFVGTSGNARQAGADQMRDPPAKWDKVDESLDETYPASDPAPAKHIT